MKATNKRKIEKEAEHQKWVNAGFKAWETRRKNKGTNKVDKQPTKTQTFYLPSFKKALVNYEKALKNYQVATAKFVKELSLAKV